MKSQDALAAVSHLTEASSAGWRLWRWVGLRGAGFPADTVLALATPSAAMAADEVLDLQARCDNLWHDLTQKIQSRIDAILRDLDMVQPGGKPAGGWPDGLASLRRALGQAKRREVGADLRERLSPTELLAVEEADRLLAQAQAAFAEAHASGTASTSVEIARCCADPLFREAVAWQNSQALASALDPLAKAAAMPGAKRKQREDFVAGYLQRYATKNDTIGFFGPVGWAGFNPSVESNSMAAGPQTISSRKVYFEDWAITLLADAMATDPELLPWLTPRRLPYLRLNGRKLQYPGGGVAELSTIEAAVLAACDGQRTVATLRALLLKHPFAEFHDARQVDTALAQLAQSNRIELGVAIPSGDPWPERVLRSTLDRVPAGPARDRALNMLDRLEAARDDVARAAGNAATLGAAMAALHATFEEMTGAASRRNQGITYGGRGLVYEDCVRDVSLTIGATTLERLHESLDLVLASARWFTSAAARIYEQEIAKVFTRLVSTSGSGEQRIDLATLWLHIQSKFFGDALPLEGLKAELARRWESLIPLSDGVTRVVVDIDNIRAAGLDLFRAENPGWHLARYQSPDLLFCANDVSQLLEGDGVAVLGEVHVGGNTLVTNAFLQQHPNAEAVIAARRLDLGTGDVFPKLSRDGETWTVRTQYAADPEEGVEILLSRGAVASAPERALLASDLDVVDASGRLMLVHDRTGWQQPLMDALGHFAFFAAGSEFRVVARRRHVPRVTIGRLVVQRETWRFDCAELAQLVQGDDAEAFVRLRWLARQYALPRFVFAKVPWEKKPFYVDLHSTIYMRILAKQIRSGARGQGGEVALSEMLPAFDELWLKDGRGRRHTCELRIVAVSNADLPDRAVRSVLAVPGGRLVDERPIDKQQRDDDVALKEPM